MPKIVCSCENISKAFGNFRALDDVSLELCEGEIFGLLGSNGAGKSTLTKIMSGLLNQDSGSVNYYGYELEKNYGKLKAFFSVVPQEVSYYYGFTVMQNMEFFGLMNGMKGSALRERNCHLIDWLQLKEFEEKPANELSGGYRRLLNIACSLVGAPDIVFMDEPTVGLDPNMRHMLWEKIRELKDENKTICLTTHYLDEAQVLCDRVGILVGGKLIVKGEPLELIKKYGGHSVLTMKVSKPIEKEDEEVISNSFVGSQTIVLGNSITISFAQEHSIERISLLTQWLVDRGYEVLRSSVKEPDLEDVFLALTKEKILVD